jgi:hypothetical protein
VKKGQLSSGVFLCSLSFGFYDFAFFFDDFPSTASFMMMFRRQRLCIYDVFTKVSIPHDHLDSNFLVLLKSFLQQSITQSIKTHLTQELKYLTPVTLCYIRPSAHEIVSRALSSCLGPRLSALAPLHIHMLPRISTSLPCHKLPSHIHIPPDPAALIRTHSYLHIASLTRTVS